MRRNNAGVTASGYDEPAAAGSSVRGGLKICDLVPALGKRGFLVGKTGSGKSTLALVLTEELYARQPLLVLDPKGTWPIPPYATLWHGLKYPIEGSYVVYRPEFGTDCQDEIDGICQMVFDNAKKGFPCAVYIDEVGPLLGRETTTGPRNLKFLYTQGRQLGVTMLCGTQRPASIPLYLMTESEYLYAFNLRNGRDRDRMGELFGPAFKETIKPFWFRFYTEQDDVHASPLKLGEDTVRMYSPGWS